jgi:hypothetical protein
LSAGSEEFTLVDIGKTGCLLLVVVRASSRCGTYLDGPFREGDASLAPRPTEGTWNLTLGVIGLVTPARQINHPGEWLKGDEYLRD